MLTCLAIKFNPHTIIAAIFEINYQINLPLQTYRYFYVCENKTFHLTGNIGRFSFISIG